MKAVGALASLVLVAAVCGCSSVTLQQPLSSAGSVADKEKFEGLWVIDDQPIVVRFTEDGVGQVAVVEWKEDAFQLVRGEFVITESKPNNFVSLRFQENGQWPERYHFVQYSFTPQGDLLLWIPDISRFEEAVTDGLLAGEVMKQQHSTEVRLSGSSEAVLQFLSDAGQPDLFRYREPIVLRRQGSSRQQ